MEKKKQVWEYLEEKIKNRGIIPIIRLDDIESAVDMAFALKAAGMDLAEVVFRTPDADEAIRRMKSAWPELTLGAGTILNLEQIDKAKAAGAEFIVSPGLDETIVEYAYSSGLLPIPGVATASEVQKAYKQGVKIVKFFPAESMGGLKTLNAFSAPFPEVLYVPTNGVGFHNIDEYLKFDHVAACAGIYPCPGELIEQKRWNEISELCVKALNMAKEARRKARI